MPRPRKPFVQMQVTRHGKKVWYFRKDRGERTRLPDWYGSPEFETAYLAALRGQPVAVVSSRHAKHGSLKWLVDLYLVSDAWTGLAAMTRQVRKPMLELMVEKRGSGDVVDVTKEDIERSMATRTVSMANILLNTVRTMFGWAVEEGHVDRNPAARIKYLKAVKQTDEEEGHKTWSEADLGRFEATFPLGTRERLVYSVILYTGLRVGDAARLGRQHVQKDGTIQIKTEKTGTDVFLPVLPPLREALATGPHGRPEELAFITGPRGRAWGKGHLGGWFAEAAERAGLVDCTAHGLRKAGAKRCAEAGATVNQMMAIFGWARPDMAIKYTFAASKKRMALEAAPGMVREQTGKVYSHLFPHPLNR
jgi:integrase